MKRNEKVKVVALAGHEVSQNVNLNISQNDVIDIAIQDQLEILESRLEQVDIAIQANDKTQKDLIEDLWKRTSMNMIESDSQFGKFMAILKGAKITYDRDLIRFSDQSDRYGKAEIIIGEYKQMDTERAEDYKSPVTYARRNTQTKNLNYCLPEKALASIEINEEGFILKLFTKVKPTTEKFKKEYQSILDPLFKDELNLRNERYKLTMDILEMKYGEKKIKARFMKTALSNSEQGRSVLALLEQATNTKLIA